MTQAHISIPPPGAAGTYSTDIRDERSDTDPSWALTLRECTELRWFFCEAESDMGIGSTFGAQLDGLLAARISDEARREHAKRRWLLTRTARRWKPKPGSELEAECVQLGVPIGDVQRARRELDGEYIYMRGTGHAPAEDPYENDSILVRIRRANMIRGRLRAAGSNAIKVLNAVYGVPSAGEGRESMRKRFGDLTEVVVAIVASQRTPDDPPARAIVRAKLTDDSFVRMMRHNAGKYLREACEAYAVTR